MTLQASGQISYNDIMDELNDLSTQASMDSMTAQAHDNTTVENVPDGIEDWYGYIHAELPTAPSGTVAVERGNGNHNDVTWTDNSSALEQELRFRLEVNINGGGFNLVTNTAPDVEFFGHAAGCIEDDSYVYRVRAENDAGNSAFDTASALVQVCA